MAYFRVACAPTGDQAVFATELHQIEPWLGENAGDHQGPAKEFPENVHVCWHGRSQDLLLFDQTNRTLQCWDWRQTPRLQWEQTGRVLAGTRTATGAEIPSLLPNDPDYTNGTISSLDLATGRIGAELATVSDAELFWIDYAPETRRIAYMQRSSAIQIIPLDAPDKRFDLIPEYRWVWDLAWFRKGTHLLAAGQDRRVSIDIWDVDRRRRIGEIDRPERFHFMAIAPNDEDLVLASERGTVLRTIRLTDQQDVWMREMPVAVRAVTWSPDRQELWLGRKDGGLEVLNAKTGATLMSLRGHAGTISSLRFLGDGERLATSSTDTTVLIWDVSEIRKVAEIRSSR
jgi:WD40 repeat protein